MRVKICGIKTEETLLTAVNSGVDYIGFVFFEKSPRNISIENAALLAKLVPSSVTKVALTVNAGDVFFDRLLREVSIDMLQLHGQESLERVTSIKEKYGKPVMKAVGVSDRSDLSKIDAYAMVADQILVDAKPPKDATLQGGNGLPFDWRLITGRNWPIPWMLAGGLTVDNVSEACALTGADQVDLSSGVEIAPGIKDPQKIAAFIKAAKGEM